MQGRFIATATATALAALAIGPAAALATPGSFVDDAVGDFAAGTAQSASVANPGVVLNRSMTNLPFGAGPGLPAGWTADQWTAGSGTAAVSNGALTADGVSAHGSTMYHPDQVLEFTGTFYGDPAEHIGFGNTLADGPWAIFSTDDGADGHGTSYGDKVKLYARTLAAAGPNDPATITSVGNDFDASAPHTYRIDWSANQVKYSVDGVVVATHNVAIAAPMRPVVSDITAGVVSGPGPGLVTVSSMGLSLYPAAGTLESRVRDAGGSKVTWGALTSTATMPSGTSVTFATRTGNTPTPDASWSAYQPVSGGAIASPGARYIQYRASLNSTADKTAAPSLDSVRIAYDLDTSTPAGGQTGGGQTGGGSSAVDKTAPKVTLVAKSLKASKKGTVSFTVGCPATEATCQITLKLKNGAKTVASKTVTVKGGKTKTVTLQLNKATRQQLKHRSLKLSSVLSASDAAGNKKTTSRKVTLHKS
jgi:hypothetical protein